MINIRRILRKKNKELKDPVIVSDITIPKQDMDDLFTLVRNGECPRATCMESVHISCVQNMSKPVDPSNPQTMFDVKLEMYPNVSTAKCKACSRAECRENFINGKCQDDYFIETFGKRLLADKYSK